VPPLSTTAGTRPLASVPTWDAIVDLEQGLPLEVQVSTDSFAGILIGFDKAMDVERRLLAADVVLELDASKLQHCLI
jgi:hypothetical protein